MFISILQGGKVGNDVAGGVLCWNAYCGICDDHYFHLIQNNLPITEERKLKYK